jgi:phosphoadenosine phosphosulfate reductase
MTVPVTSLREIGADMPERLRALFAGSDLFGRLRVLRETVDGRIVFTTSFGIEDQAIAHAIFSQALAIDVVTLDTGRLFPETYDVWAETEQRYGITIRAFYPDQAQLEALVAEQGINGFRNSVAARQACCGVRKVEPLKRALAGAAAWVTGLRADQSDARAKTPFVAQDATYNLLKAAPLADWSRAQVADYVAAENIPQNALHAKGFLSIGCAPCTRAVLPGEPERAGRWWWEQESKKECGLHDNPRRIAALAKKAGVRS